jgi:hypothetical protein
MQEKLCIGSCLKDRTIILQLLSDGAEIRQIPVMGYTEIPVAVVHDQRLDILIIICRTGRGIPIMPDRGLPFQHIGQDLLIFEHIGDQPHPFNDIEMMPFLILPIFTGDDPARFLTAMLKCMKSIIGQDGCIGMIEYAEDAARSAWFIFLESLVII